MAKRDKGVHQKHWQRILKLGKVESDLEFYSLRHHWISKLVSSGKPAFEVAKMAGHQSDRMIMQHYGHLSPNAVSDAMHIMAADVPQITLPTKTQKAVV